MKNIMLINTVTALWLAARPALGTPPQSAPATDDLGKRGTGHPVNIGPTVKEAPTSNHPGGAVNVSGTGFGPGEAVDILFDETPEAIAIVKANDTIPSTAIAVPANAVPGNHTVTAIGRRTGDAAQKNFTVETDWLKPGFGLQNKSYNPYENVLSKATVSGLDFQWRAQLPNVIETSPVIYNGRLYIGCNDGNIYAIDASTGAPLWAKSTSSAINDGLTVASGVVYIGGQNGVVSALNATTGALVWSFGVGVATKGAPVVSNGILYIGDVSGNVVALNASTGVLVWLFSPGGIIPSPPAVAAGMVYFTSSNGNLYAVNASSGTQVWTYKMTTGSNVSPVIANGMAFAADQNGGIYAVNAQTGQARWSGSIGSAGGGNGRGDNSSTSTGDGLVFFGTTSGGMYAVSTDGASGWSYNAGNPVNGASVYANGVVYFTSGSGNIFALSSSGTLLWTASTGGTLVQPVAVTNGMVYVASGDNYVYAYGLNAGNAARQPPRRPSIAHLRAIVEKLPRN